MDPTTLVPQITAAFQQHNWLALVFVLALVVRKWLGPDSKFPALLSPNWRPVVLAASGLVIAVVSVRNAGQAWSAALMAGAATAAATGFLDGLVAAIFGSAANAPKWALWIVMVFDEVEGAHGSAQGGGGGSISQAPTPVPASVPVAKRLAFALSLVALTFVTGCLSNAPIVPVTPANQDAVNQCRTDSSIHNGAVVGSLVSGAIGTAAGAVAVADSNPGVKNGMGITGAAAAGVTAVGAGIIALENQLYQGGGCPQLLGPLPVLGRDGKPVARGFVPGDLQ